ncbi:MAG: hypothetical protein AB8F95_07740 [Bacteroidia bacterium]
MNKIAYFLLTFLALGVFAIISFLITIFAWVGPRVKPVASATQSRRPLFDDDPVVLQLG